MSDKLKKICGYLLGGYVTCAVLFCWLANEHINYTKLPERYYGTVQDAYTEAIVGDMELVQPFVVETDRINEVSVLLKPLAEAGNKGRVFVELVDPVTNEVLAKSKCEIKNIAGDLWREFRMGVDTEMYRGKELALKIYTNVEENEEKNQVGAWAQFQETEGASWLAVNGVSSGMVLNFCVTGSNVSGHALYYYVAFIVGFVLLALYCTLQLVKEKKGKLTFGLKLAHVIERYHFLMEQLIARDFKTKYKRSVLGVFWSFLNPLLMMTVQYVVFVNLFKFNVDNYAVYLLTGIVLFSSMTDTTTQAMCSITGNASLITKVYVPKYIYPVTKVLSTSINLLLSMLPLVIVAVFTGLLPKWSWVFIPYGLLTQIIFVVGVAFALSSLMVFFRDIQFLWGVLTTAWTYATPIMYPIDILPIWLQNLQILNPMYHYIGFMRTVIIDGIAPEPGQFLGCAAFAAGALLVGAVIFKKTQDQFVLHI